MTNPIIPRAQRRRAYVTRDDVKGVSYPPLDEETMDLDEMRPRLGLGIDVCDDMHTPDATIRTQGADCPIRPNAPWDPDDVDLDEGS